MAFGYVLLSGRQGAAGHIRQENGKREVRARGLPPGLNCALYALKAGEGRLCAEGKGDGEGNAHWTAAEDGFLFVAAGEKLLLWEGGEEQFLAAGDYLKKRAEEQKARPAPGREETRETKKPAPARDAPPPLAPAAAPQEKAEKKPASKEKPPEEGYTLRPAGKGEPVDSLPERKNKMPGERPLL